MNQVWHREAVGGLWEEMGRLQFDFVANQGLKPDHKLARHRLRQHARRSALRFLLRKW